MSFHEDENFKIGPRAYAGPDFGKLNSLLWHSSFMNLLCLTTHWISPGFVSQVSANISSKTALIIHGNSEEALDRVVLYLILGSKFNIPDYAVVGKSRFSTGSKVNEDHMREGSDGPKSKPPFSLLLWYFLKDTLQFVQVQFRK